MQGVLMVVDNEWSVLLRIGAALLIGTIVGLEREIRDKPVGMRTMILICVGACVFTLVSQRQGSLYADVARGIVADPTRIAAQIVTGVGFLGAGAIFRSTRSIHGLTTAASIWIIAAVGMACGFGEFLIAFVSGIAVLLILWILQEVETRIGFARNIQKYRIATTDPAIGFEDFDKVFDDANLQVLRRDCYQEGDQFVFAIRALGNITKHNLLRQTLLHADKYDLLRT